MKALYKITDKNDVTLCYQVAKSPEDAVDMAKMYGHKSAKAADYIRDED